MDEQEALRIADKFLEDKKAKFEAREDGNKWFRVGEEIYVNGHLFRVKAVKPTEVRLKLLKRAK